MPKRQAPPQLAENRPYGAHHVKSRNGGALPTLYGARTRCRVRWQTIVATRRHPLSFTPPPAPLHSKHERKLYSAATRCALHWWQPRRSIRGGSAASTAPPAYDVVKSRLPGAFAVRVVATDPARMPYAVLRVAPEAMTRAQGCQRRPRRSPTSAMQDPDPNLDARSPRRVPSIDAKRHSYLRVAERA